MTIDEIILEWCNRDDGLHARKVGRYNASEISSIKKGYLKPKDFFTKKKFDMRSARRISSGRILETGFEQMLLDLKIPHEYNPKYEVKIDDFVIVCKPDFIMKDFVIETKFPATEKTWDYLFESYKYQLALEREVTGKDVYLGRFVLDGGNEFSLRFRKFLGGKELYAEAVEILRKFDSSLKIYISKYGTNKSGSQILEVPTSNKL